MMECTICGNGTARVQFDGQKLCMECYNATMAEMLEVELPKLSKTFSVNDVDGVQRIFEVERQVMSNSIVMTARERWEHGYEYAVDGELQVNQHTLFDQLKEKTKRAFQRLM